MVLCFLFAFGRPFFARFSCLFRRTNENKNQWKDESFSNNLRFCYCHRILFFANGLLYYIIYFFLLCNNNIWNGIERDNIWPMYAEIIASITKKKAKRKKNTLLEKKKKNSWFCALNNDHLFLSIWSRDKSQRAS